jgi:hypothetical protein
MVMDTDLGVAQTGEVFLSLIAALSFAPLVCP